jgi:entericidin A
MKERCALLLLLLFVMMSVSACNTVKGVGRDVESVGDAMSDAVE